MGQGAAVATSLGSLALSEGSTGAAVDVPPALSSSTPPTTALGQDKREYKNDAYHFKLAFPDTLHVVEYKEANDAITVTFESADKSQAFDVYVTPYGKAQIDQARFKLDEPSGRFLDPQDVLISGTRATLFTGYNPIMGDTREAWFIKGGFLYEVATYKGLDSWLGQVMQGWTFI